MTANAPEPKAEHEKVEAWMKSLGAERHYADSDLWSVDHITITNPEALFFYNAFQKRLEQPHPTTSQEAILSEQNQANQRIINSEGKSRNAPNERLIMASTSQDGDDWQMELIDKITLAARQMEMGSMSMNQLWAEQKEAKAAIQAYADKARVNELLHLPLKIPVHDEIVLYRENRLAQLNAQLAPKKEGSSNET